MEDTKQTDSHACLKKAVTSFIKEDDIIKELNKQLKHHKQTREECKTFIMTWLEDNDNDEISCDGITLKKVTKVTKAPVKREEMMASFETKIPKEEYKNTLDKMENSRESINKSSLKRLKS